jgi:hypothetical protein
VLIRDCNGAHVLLRIFASEPQHFVHVTPQFENQRDEWVGQLFVDYVTTLAQCHRLGTVHCDIALRNLMMTPVDGKYRGCLCVVKTEEKRINELR